jgi:uncharacterized protein with HEPN domain
MDERTAEHLLYLDATLTEIRQLAARGRTAYDTDIAVARACQFDLVRLAADLERLGTGWLEANPSVPWRLIEGMLDRYDIVWSVVEQHAPQLHAALSTEIDTARALLGQIS